jgi:tripartite-type tricarboxylate transporter receptor subunit TctC
LRSILTRRRLLAITMPSLPLTAAAFPDKTIEWVVPYPAGGGSDVVARTLAEPMGKMLGQTIVVNNKPGAATNIGADYVAKARPTATSASSEPAPCPP